MDTTYWITEAALKILEKIEPLSIEDDAFSCKFLAGVNQKIAKVVVDQGPITPMVSIETGVSSSDWMESFPLPQGLSPHMNLLELQTNVEIHQAMPRWVAFCFALKEGTCASA